jgi:hypothetical protein
VGSTHPLGVSAVSLSGGIGRMSWCTAQCIETSAATSSSGIPTPGSSIVRHVQLCRCRDAETLSGIGALDCQGRRSCLGSGVDLQVPTTLRLRSSLSFPFATLPPPLPWHPLCSHFGVPRISRRTSLSSPTAVSPSSTRITNRSGESNVMLSLSPEPVP